MWETEEGQKRLLLLICATLYIFGIRCGVGMETVSEFFKCLRLEKHLGVSSTNLRRMISKIEDAILEYKAVYERSKGEIASAAVGTDETFFDKMILVMIELSSGYILFEEPAEDRTYSTWKEKALGALKALGLNAAYMVSDNAKALVKLALDGIGCSRIPDLFHASNEIVKVMGARTANKTAGIKRKLCEAETALNLLVELNRSPAKIMSKEQIIEGLKAEQEIVLKGQSRYHEELQAFSKAVHPFSTITSSPLTSENVEENLRGVLCALKATAEEYEIKDNKKGLEKAGKQIEEIAALIDLWWIWVKESIAHFNLNAEKTKWLLNCFLPSVYWQVQLRRTSSKSLRDSYETAYKEASDLLTTHPLTSAVSEEEKVQWSNWAHWIVTKFQRTSSAVEGRNGTLARMNHNQRSIPLKRLKTLTVIHNFGIKRRDGTTAGERLFDRQFPDLFEWIVEKMDNFSTTEDQLLTS
jgi:hypothetical protein